MEHDELVDVLERIVFGSIAMTVSALIHATGELELTFTQWRAILVVGETEDGCRVGEVAQRVQGTLPATSRLLRRLEERGLMSLERDENDRRATRARLSAEGRRVREAVLGFRRDRLAVIAGNVGNARPAARVLRSLAREFDVLAK